MSDYQFLPMLTRSDAAPRPQNDSSWSREGGGSGVLAKYAAALEMPTHDLPAERFKSVPTPLARALLFEQALFHERHPAHKQITGEWRGLLAAIGLARYFGLEMTVRVARMPSAGDGIMASIRRFAPWGEEDLWSMFGIIYFENHIVGVSSPRTLVFTGIRPLTTGNTIPFQRHGRLIDPTRHYADTQEREPLSLLAKWIDKTREELSSHVADLNSFLGIQPPDSSRGEQVLGMLKEWSEETQREVQTLGMPTTDSFRGFSESPFAVSELPENSPALRTLSLLRPVESEPAENVSDMRVRDSGLVVDPGRTGLIVRNGQPFSGRVQLPRGFTQDAVDGRFSIPLTPAQLGDPTAPDLGRLFEAKLIEVKNLAQNRMGLEVGEGMYLLPLDQRILQYLDATKLPGFVSATGDRGAGITIRLEVPLRNSLSLRYEHIYHAHEVVTDFYTPNLSLWPDFRSSEWQHHFYFERSAGRANNLRLKPVTDAVEEYSTQQDSPMSWGRLMHFPTAWVGSADDTKGILLTPHVPEVEPTDQKWEISIDFGSTHTRVFKASRGMANNIVSEPVELRPRAVAITGSLEFGFFPDIESDVMNPEEPRTVLQLPLSHPPGRRATPWLPVDGTIVWDSPLTLQQLQGLKTDLKWQEEDQAGSAVAYISQIYLSASAEAAAAGARIVAVRCAYPSVFPEYLRFQHTEQWRRLNSDYGVEVHPPLKESTALAAFLEQVRGAPLAANVLAVDIGGSTSDLAVWSGGKQTIGDSVRLAGDILSRLVRNDPAARKTIADAAAKIDGIDFGWSDNNSDYNVLKFNALLREVTRKSDGRYPGSSLLAKWMYTPGGHGHSVVAHIGYLAAAVSYLLGMLARHQATEKPLYQLHFAGRGSEFLHWLTVLGEGAHEEIPGAFFKAGLGSHDCEVEIFLPDQYAKQEVGRGLLAGLALPDRAEVQRKTFVGESGFQSNGRQLSWDDPLDAEVLKGFAVEEAPPLERRDELTAFVRAFEASAATREIAKSLHLSPEVLLERAFRDKLKQSLHTLIKRADQDKDHLVLEPIFISEAKTLLEHVTGNHHLFG